VEKGKTILLVKRIKNEKHINNLGDLRKHKKQQSTTYHSTPSRKTRKATINLDQKTKSINQQLLDDQSNFQRKKKTLC